MRRTCWTWTLIAGVIAGGTLITAEPLDHGLVTALDRVGGNLLGTQAFDAVLVDPPDPITPERLRMYLSEAQSHPVEIVVTSNPPEPVRAFFRVSIGTRGGLKLEFDPNAGEIIPCILPADDLTRLGAPPADASETMGNWRPGLVTALGEIGANLLGAGAFTAVLADPPDPVAPQRLRLIVSKAAFVDFVLQNPPEPIRPLLLIQLGEEEVELTFDNVAAGSRVFPPIEFADLSAAVSPVAQR